jgi:hypothetical protein
MVAARLFVPSFAYDFSLMNDHTTHQGIGVGVSQTFFGQFEAAFHKNGIIHYAILII